MYNLDTAFRFPKIDYTRKCIATSHTWLMWLALISRPLLSRPLFLETDLFKMTN